jgi:hypothetical protein
LWLFFTEEDMCDEAAATRHLLLLEELLQRHGVVRADLEEEALHRVLVRLSRGDGDVIDDDDEKKKEEEAAPLLLLLEPVVRMAATNRELRRLGLPPLLLLHPGPDDNNGDGDADAAAAAGGDGRLQCGNWGGLDATESAALAAIGMPLDLYMLIRGDHGEVLGLRLRRDAYTKAMCACRSKRAAALRDDEPDAARAFLGERLVVIARRTAAYIAKRGGGLPKAATKLPL